MEEIDENDDIETILRMAKIMIPKFKKDIETANKKVLEFREKNKPVYITRWETKLNDLKQARKELKEQLGELGYIISVKGNIIKKPERAQPKPEEQKQEAFETTQSKIYNEKDQEELLKLMDKDINKAYQLYLKHKDGKYSTKTIHELMKRKFTKKPEKAVLLNVIDGVGHNVEAVESKIEKLPKKTQEQFNKELLDIIKDIDKKGEELDNDIKTTTNKLKEDKKEIEEMFKRFEELEKKIEKKAEPKKIEKKAEPKKVEKKVEPKAKKAIKLDLEEDEPSKPKRKIVKIIEAPKSNLSPEKRQALYNYFMKAFKYSGDEDNLKIMPDPFDWFSFNLFGRKLVYPIYNNKVLLKFIEDYYNRLFKNDPRFNRDSKVILEEREHAINYLVSKNKEMIEDKYKGEKKIPDELTEEPKKEEKKTIIEPLIKEEKKIEKKVEEPLKEPDGWITHQAEQSHKLGTIEETKPYIKERSKAGQEAIKFIIMVYSVENILGNGFDRGTDFNDMMFGTNNKLRKGISIKDSKEHNYVGEYNRIMDILYNLVKYIHYDYERLMKEFKTNKTYKAKSSIFVPLIENAYNNFNEKYTDKYIKKIYEDKLKYIEDAIDIQDKLTKIKEYKDRLQYFEDEVKKAVQDKNKNKIRLNALRDFYYLLDLKTSDTKKGTRKDVFVRHGVPSRSFITYI